MSTYVKVCGLSRPEDARVAVATGAQAIGVVFSQKSPRRVTMDQARAVIDEVRGEVDTVVVTNDLDAVEAAEHAVELGASVVQLHGNYTAHDIERARAVVPRVWRATSLADDPNPVIGASGEQALLLDAPKPGSGVTWDLRPLSKLDLRGTWLLAGGLNPDNVANAIIQVRPWGVDVSSGVESAPGRKDADRIRAFIRAVREVQVP